MANVTILSLENSYKNKLQAQNPKINAFAPNSSWDLDAAAISGVLLDLYFNLDIVKNSIYAQNLAGDQVDIKLYELGLPERGTETYATIIVRGNIPDLPITLTEGEIFTDPVSNNTFEVLDTITLTNSAYPYSDEAELFATIIGAGVVEPVGATVTHLAVNLTVASSTNGQNLESDQSCITRILQSIRAPQGNVRTTDYAIFALQSNTLTPNPRVTNSIIIPEFIEIDGVKVLGVSPLVGTAISEWQLDRGLLPATLFTTYSRKAGAGTLALVDNYMQSQRLVGLSVFVIPTETFLVTNMSTTLDITVSLAEGYTLATVLKVDSQLANGTPIIIELTIEQLIQKAARRAICDQPFGGTIIGGLAYITLDSIRVGIDNDLSINNGSVAQVLTNLNIAGSDIEVPLFDLSAEYLQYVYDIGAYDQITVASV